MYLRYIVKHYSENRIGVYTAFAFDCWNDAIEYFNKLCKEYENTHDIISLYEYSYDDDMYFEVTATHL